uniref:C2H2-type domain-containing protein n=1 Tax=Aegilops tauschii subsp. strangulata TaxID=200361 RepID=A0A453M973_AEGTS
EAREGGGASCVAGAVAQDRLLGDVHHDVGQLDRCAGAGPQEEGAAGESCGHVRGGGVRVQDLRACLRDVPGARRAPDQPPARPPWAGARRRRRQGHQAAEAAGGKALGVGVARAIKERKRQEDKQHDCHICGLGFETAQALGGHMRRHREEMEEMALSGAIYRWVALSDQEAGHQAAADRPPVLLQLFV